MPLNRDSKAGRARMRLAYPVYWAVRDYLASDEPIKSAKGLRLVIEQALLRTKADDKRDMRREQGAYTYNLRGLLSVEG